MSKNARLEYKRQLIFDSGDISETTTEWFIGIDGERQGPLSEDQLIALIDHDELKPSDYVWRYGMEQWAYLRDVLDSWSRIEQRKTASADHPYSNSADESVETNPQLDGDSPSSIRIRTVSKTPTQKVDRVDFADNSRHPTAINASVNSIDSEPVPKRHQASTESDQSFHDEHSYAAIVDESKRDVLEENPASVQADQSAHDEQSSAAFVDESERESIDGVESLEQESFKMPIPRYIDATRADSDTIASIPANPNKTNQVGYFRIPSTRSFGGREKDGSLEESYSLANLVRSAPRIGGPKPATTSIRSANEDNSGLIDIGKLNAENEETTPPDETNETSIVVSQPVHESDTLIPIERTIYSRNKKSIGIALVAGGCVIVAAVVGSFLIVSSGIHDRSLSATTSPATGVSRIASQNLSGERKASRFSTQPQTGMDTIDVFERKTVDERKNFESTLAAMAPKTNDAFRPKNDYTLSRKRSRSGLEEDNQQNRSQVPSGTIFRDKAQTSTDALFDRAVGLRDKANAPSVSKSERQAKVAKDAKAEKPPQPSRGETLTALRAIIPAVKACGRGSSGVVEAMISVEGVSGKVTKVTITGVESSLHGCMKKAIGNARFPSFSKKKIDIRFPFRL